jgi:hypothetical protein
MVKAGATSPIAPFVRKASSFFAKPSPTSTLPSVVSATILAAVEAGTATSTPDMPVSMSEGAFIACCCVVVIICSFQVL